MSKTQKQPEFGGRDYYEIKTAPHICICCATLFTRILQTMHYHFKAGQVCVIPCPHMKQDEIVFVVFFLIIYLLACLQAKSKGAAINQLIFAVNLRWLSHDLRKVTGVNSAVCTRGCLMRDRCLKDTFWRILCYKRKLLSLLTLSFIMCRQSKSPQNTFCFQSGSLAGCLKNKGSRMCVCQCGIWQIRLHSVQPSRECHIVAHELLFSQ